MSTLIPRVGSQCPRCGKDVVTGQPTPSCVVDGKHDADICAVWCKEENYADDLCASCEAVYETGARNE